ALKGGIRKGWFLRPFRPSTRRSDPSPMHMNRSARLIGLHAVLLSPASATTASSARRHGLIELPGEDVDEVDAVGRERSAANDREDADILGCPAHDLASLGYGRALTALAVRLARPLVDRLCPGERL